MTNILTFLSYEKKKAMEYSPFSTKLFVIKHTTYRTANRLFSNVVKKRKKFQRNAWSQVKSGNNSMDECAATWAVTMAKTIKAKTKLGGGGNKEKQALLETTIFFFT